MTGEPVGLGHSSLNCELILVWGFQFGSLWAVCGDVGLLAHSFWRGEGGFTLAEEAEAC